MRQRTIRTSFLDEIGVVLAGRLAPFPQRQTGRAAQIYAGPREDGSKVWPPLPISNDEPTHRFEGRRNKGGHRTLFPRHSCGD